MVIKKFESSTGKNYTCQRVLYSLLKECKNRVDNKFDAPIIITGSVGSGKSNLGFLFGGLWEEHFHNRTFTLDNIHFRAEKITEETNRDDNYTHFIGFDEAIQGGSSRDGLTKIGNVLRKAFITKRYKRHLIVACVDNLKELNDKIIERCVCWLHVHYDRLPNGSFRRGRVKIFKPTEALIVYDDLKNKRCWTIQDHYVWKRKINVYNTMNYSEIWFTEKDYNIKKTKETNLIEKEDNKRVDKVLNQRNILINYLVKEKILTRPKVGNLIGISGGGIQKVTSKSTTPQGGK